MLKRTILNDLIDWKARKHHPLIISGLRQIGKTYIVKEFGKSYYENVVYIDFRLNQSIHKAFDGNFDINDLIIAISANIPNTNFVEHKTLVILDEIQDCPNARSSLKYWDIDGRFDVIATGSFLGVKGFRGPYTRGIPVGYEESIEMHPLTFKEFLLNSGISQDVLDYVESSLYNLQPVNPAVHESMRNLYLQYLVVGGMPEAVNCFLETHDINQVRKIQSSIIQSIKDDFGRYKNSRGNYQINEVLKLRAEACLDSLPSQLSKEYKKFQYSLVEIKGKSTEKADGLQYLIDVGLVLKANNINEITLPLEGVKLANEFKIYYSDTGLLMSQIDKGATLQILQNNMGAYKGAIAENMVASSLNSIGMNLYYYHAPSGSPELDFIVNYKSQAMIVECKSTNNRATSMKFVLSHPDKYGKHPAVKIADSNIGQNQEFITIPLYTLGFLTENMFQEDIPNLC